MPLSSIARKKLNIELYKKIYRIRSAEKGIIDHYPEDEMKTPMHMSMGEEHITAGICMALGKRNQAFGYYRSHALYISKTDETKEFFGEMYGKATGVVRGKGGSMHLAAPDAGLLGVSAVVASTIAPAIGAAFANSMLKNNKIVAAFFGDGAMEEGVSWESLNAACLFHLPIIFVCEDNGLAVDVTHNERRGFKSIPHIASQFNCHVIKSSDTDPEKIYELTKKAMMYIKTTRRPVFMHLMYNRYLQHIGIKDDFDVTGPAPKGGFEKVGYRDRVEYDHWLKRDSLKLQRKKLLSFGVTERALASIENKIDKEIETNIKNAQQAPFPEKKELYNNVFYEA